MTNLTSACGDIFICTSGCFLRKHHLKHHQFSLSPSHTSQQSLRIGITVHQCNWEQLTKREAAHLTYIPELYLRIISRAWFLSWKQLLMDEAARVSVTTVASVWQRATDKWLCLSILEIWNPFLFHQFLGLDIWAHPFDWSNLKVPSDLLCEWCMCVCRN